MRARLSWSCRRPKRHWIYEKTRHGQNYPNRPHPPGKELVTGESALYLGRSYRIEVVEDEMKGVQFDQGFLVPASRVPNEKATSESGTSHEQREQILPRVVNRA